MRKRFSRFLKKWPALHHLATSVYDRVSLKNIEELVRGTEAQERFWSRRHLRRVSDWGENQPSADDWVMSYWESRHHSHRAFLIERITAYYPFKNVLELGCNCGPNLYLLEKKYPDTMLKGIDINPSAVQKGNEFFKAENIANVELSVGKVDELEQVPDKSFDVVFTDAVLIYVGKDKIEAVIRDMVRIASKAIILLERQCLTPGKKDTRGLGYRYGGAWERDYVALLKKWVPEERIKVTKVTEDVWPDARWKETGAVVEVRL